MKESMALGSWRRQLSQEHRTIGVAIVRVGIGLTVLVFYLTHLRQGAFLWGDNGVIPFHTFTAFYKPQGGSLSLFQISSNVVYERALFLASVVVTALFTLGLYTRTVSVLFWLTTWSVYMRNPYLLDGGNNVLYLVAFYLMFTDCGRHFSLDQARSASPAAPSPLRALLHNAGVLTILLQMCVLYFISAVSKLGGHPWQSGTAIYYVLRGHEFLLSSSSNFLFHSGIVVCLLTYGTLLYELSWPFLIWFRGPRVLMVLGAFALHGMIGYVMGLMWFSFVMCVVEMVIISDAQYILLAHHVKRYWQRLAPTGGAQFPVACDDVSVGGSVSAMSLPYKYDREGERDDRFTGRSTR